MYLTDTVQEILNYFKEMTEHNYSQFIIESDLKAIIDTATQDSFDRGYLEGKGDGYEEGYEEGYAAGYNDGVDDYKEE